VALSYIDSCHPIIIRYVTKRSRKLTILPPTKRKITPSLCFDASFVSFEFISCCNSFCWHRHFIETPYILNFLFVPLLKLHKINSVHHHHYCLQMHILISLLEPWFTKPFHTRPVFCKNCKNGTVQFQWRSCFQSNKIYFLKK
jgi:hypothetical protein